MGRGLCYNSESAKVRAGWSIHPVQTRSRSVLYAAVLRRVKNRALVPAYKDGLHRVYGPSGAGRSQEGRMGREGPGGGWMYGLIRVVYVWDIMIRVLG